MSRKRQFSLRLNLKLNLYCYFVILFFFLNNDNQFFDANQLKPPSLNFKHPFLIKCDYFLLQMSKIHNLIFFSCESEGLGSEGKTQFKVAIK